jgi:hypothetical protein
LKIHPLGTDDKAAPIKKTPTVNAANDFDAPSDVADKGPTVVSRVDVERVNAHANARRQMFQYGELDHEIFSAIIVRAPILSGTT